MITATLYIKVRPNIVYVNGLRVFTFQIDSGARLVMSRRLTSSGTYSIGTIFPLRFWLCRILASCMRIDSAQ